MKAGADDETKRTNEIGTAEALMDLIPDICSKTVTADALLTQRKFARYLLGRGAHYVFIVKGNQKTLLEDVTLAFETAPAREPDFEEEASLAHGRIEQRAIRTTTALNDYLDFLGVGQAFMIERSRQDKKSGEIGTEIACGVTSHTPDSANAQSLLALNRGHWCIENSSHHCLDWTWDEDRSRIRSGFGPENMTRLRRFAIGLIKGRGLEVAPTVRRLARNVRAVPDLLKMTGNTRSRTSKPAAPA